MFSCEKVTFIFFVQGSSFLLFRPWNIVATSLTIGLFLKTQCNKNDKDTEFKDNAWKKKTPKTTRRGSQQWKQCVFSSWLGAFFVMWWSLIWVSGTPEPSNETLHILTYVSGEHAPKIFNLYLSVTVSHFTNHTLINFMSLTLMKILGMILTWLNLFGENRTQLLKKTNNQILISLLTPLYH